MDIGTVHPASPADRDPLQRMLELYQYELSDIWDQDLNEQGEYGYALDKFFDPLLRGHTHHAFIVRAEGQFAGFALVNDALKVGAVGQGHGMDQFFILRTYAKLFQLGMTPTTVRLYGKAEERRWGGFA